MLFFGGIFMLNDYSWLNDDKVKMLNQNNIDAIYEEFVKNFGFYEKGHFEPKFPQDFINELQAIFPSEMNQYYTKFSGVCAEANFLVSIGLFNAGHGWKHVVAKPLEELKVKNRKTLLALCTAYNKFKEKQREAQKIQEAKDRALKEFYESFASLFCITTQKVKKAVDLQRTELPNDVRSVLEQIYPKEMREIKQKEYGAMFAMRAISTTWFFLQDFGLADLKLEPDRYGPIPKRFEELDKRAKETLLKLQEIFQHCNIGIKKVSGTSKTSKGNEKRYFLERNIGNGNKISYSPQSNSIMVVDKDGNGLCYYKDGYVNPVRNGKTFPSEGMLVEKYIYHSIRDCFNTGVFDGIQQYLPASVVANGLFLAPLKQQNFATFKTQKHIQQQALSTYVQVPINNTGDLASFNPKNPTSIMMYNKNTGFGYCYYPDGYVNPVRNMQTMPQYGFNNGVQGQIYFYNLLQQVNRMYKASQYAKLKDQYEANNKSISKSPLIGMYNQHGLSNGFN